MRRDRREVGPRARDDVNDFIAAAAEGHPASAADLVAELVQSDHRVALGVDREREVG